MTDEEFLDRDPRKELDPLDRAARIASVRDKLQSCLHELDSLGAWQASASVTMAIDALTD